MIREDLDNLVIQTRRDILRMVHAVNSGHPGGSLGCVEFFVTLYNRIMKHDGDNNSKDIFILSNGHISPVYYSTLARSGYFDIKELKRCSDYYTELLQTVHTPMVTDHLQQLKNAIDNSIKKTDQSGNVNNFRMMQDKLDHFRNQSFTTAYPEWAHLYA